MEKKIDIYLQLKGNDEKILKSLFFNKGKSG